MEKKYLNNAPLVLNRNKDTMGQLTLIYIYAHLIQMNILVLEQLHKFILLSTTPGSFHVTTENMSRIMSDRIIVFFLIDTLCSRGVFVVTK